MGCGGLVVWGMSNVVTMRYEVMIQASAVGTGTGKIVTLVVVWWGEWPQHAKTVKAETLWDGIRRAWDLLVGYAWKAKSLMFITEVARLKRREPLEKLVHTSSSVSILAQADWPSSYNVIKSVSVDYCGGRPPAPYASLEEACICCSNDAEASILCPSNRGWCSWDIVHRTDNLPKVWW